MLVLLVLTVQHETYEDARNQGNGIEIFLGVGRKIRPATWAHEFSSV